MLEYPLNINKSNSCFKTVKTFEENQKNMIKLFFKTPKGSRLNPVYGSTLFRFIGAPKNSVTANIIREVVTNELIQNFGNKINLVSVTVTPIIQDDIFIIKIEYVLKANISQNPQNHVNTLSFEIS